MSKFYVVEYTRHNKTTDAWAYKSELGTANKDEAEKKAHAIYAEFIGGDTFDHVNVNMKDEVGIDYINLTWTATAEPQPTVTTDDVVAKLIADGVISQEVIADARATLEA